MRPLSDYCSIVWIFIRMRLLRFMRFSQYYMFLRQVPQGQEALEKAVANAPDNYWYSQGLASLYQQQNELDKAVTLLEQMVVRFPAKQDPLFNLLDLYGRQEKYDEVISTLKPSGKAYGQE